MTSLEDVVLSAAVRLSPRWCRRERREQWAADARDAHELGLSRWGVVLGALSTSLVSRGAYPRPHVEAISNKGVNMSYFSRNRGPIIRLAGGLLATSAVAAAAVAACAGVLVQGIASMDSKLSLIGQPNVTYGDAQPGQWGDVSKLTIVGEIDSQTGKETPVTPYHPQTIPSPAPSH